MGTLVYDDDRRAEIEDRTLAHLQVIIVEQAPPAGELRLHVER